MSEAPQHVGFIEGLTELIEAFGQLKDAYKSVHSALNDATEHPSISTIQKLIEVSEHGVDKASGVLDETVASQQNARA